MPAIRRLAASAALIAAFGLGVLLLDGQGAAWGQAAALMAASESAEQESPEIVLSADLTPEERRDLLARLTDAQVRELLLQQFDATSAAEAAGGRGRAAGFVQDFSGTMSTLRSAYATMFAALGDLPELPAFVFARLTEDREPIILIWVVVAFSAMILGGLAAEWAFDRVIRPFRRQIETATTERLMARFGYLSLRVVLDLLALAVFGLAALGVFFLFYQGHQPIRHLVLSYLWAVVLLRVVLAISRFLLAPKAPSLRVIALDDEAASMIHGQVFWVALVWIFGSMTAGLLDLLGVNPSLIDFGLTIMGVVLLAMILVAVWRVRAPIAGLIRGETQNDDSLGGRARRTIASVWHLLAMIYVFGIWGLSELGAWVLQVPTSARSVSSLLIVIAVPLIDVGLRKGLTGHFAERRAGEGAVEADVEPTLTPFQNILLRGLRIIVLLAAVVLFARIWGVDVFALSSAGIGAEMTRGVLEVGVTLLLAHLLWEMAKSAIDRRLQEEAGEEGAQVESGGEGGGAGSRIKTLLPLFRKFLLVTIVVMAVMITLSAMGVQIGPLLAGAGVIGIAIGFGAQTLVRDVVSGIFFLLDDAFRIGEYVDVGAAKGTVERITVRSLILRHHRGTLNIVPFGEIQNVSNFSRDWVIMKLQFRVTYDTDVNKVKKIFKQIGAELMEDELLGPGFIEPLKSQGVLAMEDSAMILRAKFMAKPGQQFMIRKEVYRRIQEAFRENGIEFAHREVTVHVPGVSDLAERDERSPAGAKQPQVPPTAEAVKEAASAAALAVLAEEEEQAQGQAPAETLDR